jgi:CDP-2,3-bis-(O-geranylgeranyl)-sn-glycerol synthase
MPKSASLAREVAATAWLLFPLLVGALVHGVCMRQGWLACLARPIDGDRTWRGRPIFGHSKTFRGPICVAAGTAAGFALESAVCAWIDTAAALVPFDPARVPWWLFGAAGFAAELSELPNSFVKRRLGIAPGHTAKGVLSVVFYAWDQLDLLLGWWLVLAIALRVSAAQVAVSLVLVGSLHPLTTLAGYLLGMRPTAR